MTAHQPRRRVEPLAPPPGAFDEVFSRAQTRRQNKLVAVLGVTAVFAVGIMGGLAMGGVSGVQDTIVALANREPDLPTSSPPAGQENSGSPVPSKSEPEKTASAPRTSSASIPAQGRQLAHGLVVNAAGEPVSGLYVYPGTISGDAFVPTSTTPTAITRVKGKYVLPCTGGYLLLSPWQLDTPLGASAGGQWASRIVAAPECGSDAAVKKTVVQPGATIEGHLATDKSCPDQIFSVWVRVSGDRAVAVRLSGLSEGDAYRISGLPEGSHVLTGRQAQTSVDVPAAGTVSQNVTVHCSDTAPPTETPEPDESETPDDPASPSGTPSPTPAASTPEPGDG